jgi:uncharacterized protein YkwD
MESRFSVRVLVAVGAALLVPVCGPSAPLSGSTAGPASTPTSTHLGALAGTTVGSTSETVLAGRHARATSRRTTARWSGSISVNRRPAVESAYRRSFAPGLSLGTGWTGSDSACRPGSVSASSQAATLRAVNFARALGGLAPVRFSPALNARSQRTALMMSANRTLSHTPSPGWRCYSRVGATNAARSNLALSYPSITSSGLVGLYLSEPGSGNTAVGHRRWLLNPFATTMGSGSTGTANAITVIGPTAANRPNPAWVSWPTAGYFPSTLEPGGRWSLSAGNSQTDFRRATVRVYRNGDRVRAVKLRVATGYAQPTLVWQIPAREATSGTYRVVVSGVRRAGTSTPFGRTYDVRMFTPSS